VAALRDASFLTYFFLSLQLVMMMLLIDTTLPQNLYEFVRIFSGGIISYIPDW
jgi:hypothetical protein